MITPEEEEERRAKARAEQLAKRAEAIQQLEEEEKYEKIFGLSQKQLAAAEAAAEREKQAKKDQRALEKVREMEQKNEEKPVDVFLTAEIQVDNAVIESRHIEDSKFTDINVSDIVKRLLNDAIPAQFIHKIDAYRVSMLIFYLKQVLRYTIERIKTTVLKN